MSSQEFQLSVLMEALAGLNPKCLTVDQMLRILRALEGKEAAYKAEIEARKQAEINRRALTGFEWSAA
jgi:hypothetical protein